MAKNEVRYAACAKLNLSLDIVGVRGDGYHLMDMVMQSIQLCDDITIKQLAKPGVLARSNKRYLPSDMRNSAVKAANLLVQRFGIDHGFEIYIKKRIPTQAGMGGGSADAAAVLAGVNALCELGLSQSELMAFGEQVGADVPFCVAGGAARVTGIGERVAPLPSLSDAWFVVMMPPRGNSTRELFSRFDAANGYERPHTDAMEQALRAGDIAQAAILMVNVFETFEKDPVTAEYKRLLLENGALGASLTGSGAAVFGVFSEALKAKRCMKQVAAKCQSVFVAPAAPSGFYPM